MILLSFICYCFYLVFWVMFQSIKLLVLGCMYIAKAFLQFVLWLLGGGK